MGERINRRKASNWDLVFAFFPLLKERLNQKGGNAERG